MGVYVLTKRYRKVTVNMIFYRGKLYCSMERAALPVYLVAGCDFVVLASAAVYADPRRRRCCCLVGDSVDSASCCC